MRLDRVVIVNLRNIESAEVHLGPGVNWLVGGNGAGKTSVLEAIYLLARGRSFRISRVQPVIRRGCASVQVYAHGFKDGGAEYSVGVEKTATTYRVKVNGETVHRISDLAIGLPLQIVGPNSFHILDRGPSFRRRLLDWGVFHVEHAYKNWYADYERCLRQRNAALRGGNREFWIWDSEMARTGERIAAWRKDCAFRIGAIWQELAAGFDGLSGVTFRYYQGWPAGTSLAACLARNRTTDSRRGYSTSGIQTADLQILIEGQPAVDLLSRGEQKILILLMHLAQARAIHQYAGEKPLILIDDLPSELDDRKGGQLMALLRSGGWQCCLTSVSTRYAETSMTPHDRMFHVKHGRISG